MNDCSVCCGVPRFRTCGCTPCPRCGNEPEGLTQSAIYRCDNHDGLTCCHCGEGELLFYHICPDMVHKHLWYVDDSKNLRENPNAKA